jgi:hypothetical protein
MWISWDNFIIGKIKARIIPALVKLFTYLLPYRVYPISQSEYGYTMNSRNNLIEYLTYQNGLLA